jgi:hypothetical protein
VGIAAAAERRTATAAAAAARRDSAQRRHHCAADGEALRAALDKVLAGEPVPEPHHPSMGCGINWKPGNQSS